MFKNLKYLILFSGLVLAAKPMESLTNYNVIMVHGAGGYKTGMDCDGGHKLNFLSYYE